MFESNIIHNAISMRNMCVYRSSIILIIGIGCGFIFLTIIISAIIIPSYAVSPMTTKNIATTALLPNFSFAAAGDWACNSNAISTVKNIVKNNPNLVLGLGDYYYGDYLNESRNPDCWFKIVKPIVQKMRIAIGNHESESPSLLKLFMNHFNLTNQYYSFNYQNVHFVALSAEIPLGIGSEQYNFVKSDLAKAASSPNINWIIRSITEKHIRHHL